MEPQEIHIRDYLRILSKRRAIVITFFIIVVTVVTIATFTVTPVYKANIRILIEKNESNPLDSNPFVRYDPEFLATQNEIIKSFNVAKSVVKALSLDTAYSGHFFPEETGDNRFIQKMLNTIFNFIPNLLRLNPRISRSGNLPDCIFNHLPGNQRLCRRSI